MISDGQITCKKSFKIMEPINLNGDATTLTIDTSITKRDVL